MYIRKQNGWEGQRAIVPLAVYGLLILTINGLLVNFLGATFCLAIISQGPLQSSVDVLSDPHKNTLVPLCRASR